jgi:hypothetical protein
MALKLIILYSDDMEEFVLSFKLPEKFIWGDTIHSLVGECWDLVES